MEENGRGTARAPALLAVPPTDGASEAAERRGLQSIFFSARIGSRWVYINFEGRTSRRAAKKRGF